MRFNYEEEIPVRDPKTGLCIQCEIGEVGELLGLIDPQDPLREFKGYTNQDATDRKVSLSPPPPTFSYFSIVLDFEGCFQERRHVL